MKFPFRRRPPPGNVAAADAPAREDHREFVHQGVWLKSRWVFSITFAALGHLIDGALMDTGPTNGTIWSGYGCQTIGGRAKRPWDAARTGV